MRIEKSVTSISWIPSEAMTGLMRVPMDLGVGHYDSPPPDRIDPSDLEGLRDADRYRFANRLAAWIEVEEGEIVDAGYTGMAYVGSTTARLGVAITVPGVGFPLLQSEPVVERDRVSFTQTAGGRTGAPFPRRIERPPFVRVTAPTAWTTLSLSIEATGGSESDLIGASPFPRHWIYDHTGTLTAKSGLIDFAEWTRVYDHDHTPWHDYQREALLADVESQVERGLSTQVMSSRHQLLKIPEGDDLLVQWEPNQHIYLVLDGMLHVAVDGETIAELGPGAIVGERSVLEGGLATSTVTAVTTVRVARIPADDLDRDALDQVAAGHHRETQPPAADGTGRVGTAGRADQAC
jgi:hypothetical protein